MLDNPIIETALHYFETPFYLYDFNNIESKIRQLKNTLPANSWLFYSVKANPNIAILNLMKDQIDGLEVSSEGELFAGLYAGYLAEKIIFVGPGKTYNELLYAVKSNILAIVVESVTEISILKKIAEELKSNVNILIRINPSNFCVKTKYNMTGVASQFGIEEEFIPDAINEINRCTYLHLKGIHVFLGTQILDNDDLLKLYTYINKLALNISITYNVTFSMIDFGGGFGIPYLKGEHPLDMEDRKMIFFPILMQIPKSKIKSYDRYAEIINKLVEMKLLEWKNETLALTANGELWSGNISELFISEKRWKDYVNVFLKSYKNKTNPYNEDKMGVEI